ncbi:hypothetical protein BJV77DRAFT_709733 [Russula vinacea]|nr:hypothetical protein BJV77DRAFT_709733 [Russula vinacea]
MFNVMLKWDDPLNRKLGVPEPYEPLDCGQFANTMESNSKSRSLLTLCLTEPNSSNIHAMSPDDAEGVTYKFRNRGALLSLPTGGRRKDVIRTKAFEDYIRDNVVSWYTWARTTTWALSAWKTYSCFWPYVGHFMGCRYVVENTMDAKISLASRPLNNGAASFVWTNNQGPVGITTANWTR